ncbi:MAG: hypothetical protein EWM51_07205 [Treponema sp.]|nr:MAG: hypothetical protein EWM51_07205 [Treponema sp.]
MSLSVCVCDKSIPSASAFSSLLRDRCHSVGLLCAPGSDALSEISWNRSSVLSAETVPLEMKSRFGAFDALVLCFDTAAVRRSVSGLEIPGSERMSMVRAIDEYVRGYALLLAAVADTFKERQSGRFVFALRQPSKGEDQSDSRALSVRFSAALAESAFVRCAEECASVCSEQAAWTGVHTLLLKFDAESEQEGFDQIASWLESANPKNQGVRWIKAGSRGIFGLR